MGKDLKEKYEKICSIKERALSLLEMGMNQDVSAIDAKEIGELMDIVKDAAEAIKYSEEACYFSKVTEAMENGSKEENSYYLNKYIPEYEGKFYNPIMMAGRMRDSRGRYMYTPYWHMDPMTGYEDYDEYDEKYRDRMYYSSMNGGSGSRSGSSNYTNGGNSGGRSMNVANNGGGYSNGMGSRSSVSRRTYMDMKDADKGVKTEKLKEVMEDFIDEMDETFVEGHATPEEKKVAKQILINYINSKLS